MTLLVAKQKVGKSFLCLQMGVEVAMAENIRLDVQAQDVLYLALEDTLGLMQERLQKMLLGAPAPNRLHIKLTGPQRIRAWKFLEAWLRQHREIRLVIIDTFAKICHIKQGSYDADYATIAKFKASRIVIKSALVVVHHMRKTGAKDEFDVVNGSTGLTGAADTIALLNRQRFQTEGTLLITGRNQRESKLALNFDEETGIWELQEPTERSQLTPERQEIVDLLKKTPGPWRLREIAKALGKKSSNLGNLLKSLIKQEIIERPHYGQYQLKG